MADINVERLQQRLLALNATQDSIQALSQYFQVNDAATVCAVWWDTFQVAPTQSLLPMLYLLNDVVQRSRNKTQAYLAEFPKYMEKAFTLGALRCPDKAAAFRRLPEIWSQRQVYSARFCGALNKAIDKGVQDAEKAQTARAGGGDAHGDSSVASRSQATSPAGVVRSVSASASTLAASGGPGAVAPTAAGAAGEEQVIAMFLRMTTTQALAEADRRREIAGFAARAADEVDVGILKAQLAALQAVASTTAAAPAAATDAGASTVTATSHSAAPVLSRLRDAERALRLAHSLLKANGQRRNGFIAKLSDSLAAASERASALEAEAARAQAALQRLQELAVAAADGKTLRRPRPEATSPLSSDGGSAGFASFNVAAAMRGGGGGGGGGTWAMPTDGSAGLEAYLGLGGHAGGGDGVGSFAWGMPGGDGTGGADGVQYWPQAGEAGPAADAVAGARLLDAYAAEGDEVQRAAEDEAAAAAAGAADEEHDSRAYVPSGAPAYPEAGRGSGVGSSGSGPKASGRAAGSAARAEAAPLDIQSLIGPGKRWDGLRGMWVDEEEKRPAVEDAWRDH